MIKFDLERALAGDALVTREGVDVAWFGLPRDGRKGYPYECSMVGGCLGSVGICEYTSTGKYWADLRQSRLDLFMKYEAKAKVKLVKCSYLEISHDVNASALDYVLVNDVKFYRD